jgi:hypothetical protein
MAPLSLHAGVNWKLEAAADEMLAAYRATLTTAAEKTEILSEAQLTLRVDREVYNSFGVADGQLFNGIYGRDHNPEFGRRPSRHRRTDD